VLRSADGDRLAAEAGTPSAVELRLDLPYQQDVVGSLLLGRRGPAESFSPSDRRLLEDLARQAGVAIHAVRLTAELQRTRERLVGAREEERRRLRRDLRDGLGPRLASLCLQLAALRNALGHETALQARVTGVKEQTQEAVEDVRRLVEGLRPPALDELGLVGAIEQCASRYSIGLRATVEAPGTLCGLPAAVEVAAFRIATEALTNCVRHAHATACTVRLAIRQSPRLASLELEIVDDGAGVRSGAAVGTGMLSMRERAEELGGTCTVNACADGGTRVLAVLPLLGRSLISD
jgi:signal transduction histidine kinase